ncbi:MAG: diguanylate cyclase, partial [Christensenellaceae bacterium]|nr:diguanylate cyclase [Christensenellaceae bacterium]
MSKFIIRRLALAIVIVLLGSLTVYTVIRSLPTSYVEAVARQNSTQPGSKSYREILKELNEKYNMNSDIFTGFVGWLGSAIKGDFGNSWIYNKPVTEKFSEVIWYSVVLNIVTFFLQFIIAIPLGILAA